MEQSLSDDNNKQNEEIVNERMISAQHQLYESLSN